MTWEFAVFCVIFFIIFFILGYIRGVVAGGTEMWNRIHDDMRRKGVHICEYLTEYQSSDSK